MDTECEHGTRNGNRCEDCEALALLHAEIDRLRAAIERALAELAALRAERDALARAAIELERAAKRFMEAINEQFDAENPDEARDAGREPRPLDDVMESRSSAWISLERGIHYSAKARAALGER